MIRKTTISGRYVEISMLPLSFKECLDLHPSEDIERSFELFLRFGSLPGVDPSRGEKYCYDYLEGIFNTVLIKNVLERKELRSVRKLTDVARFLFSNIGNTTNDAAISKGAGLNPTTADRYIEGLVEGMLFHHVERYDIVRKKLMETNGKYYATDLGIGNAALGSARGTDISRPMENVVFIELKRRGYVVRTGSLRDSEVDFIATKDGITEYYQVPDHGIAGYQGAGAQTVQGHKGQLEEDDPDDGLSRTRIGGGGGCGQSARLAAPSVTRRTMVVYHTELSTIVRWSWDILSLLDGCGGSARGVPRPTFSSSACSRRGMPIRPSPTWSSIRASRGRRRWASAWQDRSCCRS